MNLPVHGPNARSRRLAPMFGAFVFALLALTHVQAESDYPNRPIRVVVPFGPGGIADISLRVAAEKMSIDLGQQIIVDNQPGGGGRVAARSVLNAPADGYTLALLSNGTAISVPLFENLGFDPLKDFVPISSIASFDFVLATNAASPHKQLTDIVAAARAKPDGLNVGTIAVGSSQNLSAELLKTQADITFTIVPYKNTPDLLVALLRNDVDLMIDTYAAVRSAVEDGRVRVLALSGNKRSPLLADVPTVLESGVPDFEVTSWNGLFAPAGTPQTVVDLLNRRLRDVLALPEVAEKYRPLGIDVAGGTPEDLQARLGNDIAKWTKVIEKAGIEKQ